MKAEHQRKTLLGYTKEELAEYCLNLEHNNKALKMQFEVQYQNCVKIINDMNLLNKGLTSAKMDGKK